MNALGATARITRAHVSVSTAAPISTLTAAPVSRKSFLITLENDITEAEFEQHYLSTIRKANAHNPGCEFVTRATWPPLHTSMRKLGIDPCKIIVILAGGQQFTNPYGSKILRLQSYETAKQCAIGRTNADIYWRRPRVAPTPVSVTKTPTPELELALVHNNHQRAITTAPVACISNIRKRPPSAQINAQTNAHTAAPAVQSSEIADVIKRRAKKSATGARIVFNI